MARGRDSFVSCVKLLYIDAQSQDLERAFELLSPLSYSVSTSGASTAYGRYHMHDLTSNRMQPTALATVTAAYYTESSLASHEPAACESTRGYLARRSPSRSRGCRLDRASL